MLTTTTPPQKKKLINNKNINNRNISSWFYKSWENVVSQTQQGTSIISDRGDCHAISENIKICGSSKVLPVPLTSLSLKNLWTSYFFRVSFIITSRVQVKIWKFEWVKLNWNYFFRGIAIHAEKKPMWYFLNSTNFNNSLHLNDRAKITNCMYFLLK